MLSLFKKVKAKVDGGVSFKNATDEELEVMLWRGRMVEELRKQDFFTHHLVPAVVKKLDDVRDGLEWRPGSTEPTMEKIAMDRIWRSGMLAGASTISDVMNEMLYEAEKAQKEINDRDQKVRE